MSAPSILVVPAVEKGRGGGHLIRSLTLVRKLRDLNREAFLCLPAIPDPPMMTDPLIKGGPVSGQGTAYSCSPVAPPWLQPRFAGLAPSPQSEILAGCNQDWLLSPEAAEEKPWSLIILDHYRTGEAEFARWASHAPLLGIDEGGSCRDRFDFLIDLLPAPREFSPPNLRCPALLPLPKNRRASFAPSPEAAGRPRRILVSFGAEDPRGLGVLAAREISRRLFAQESAPEIDLVYTGPEPEALPGVRLLAPRRELREELAGYDLAITHFGLTAFEAVHARLPAALLSPGPYHEKLARHTGFFSAGLRRRGARRLARLLFPRRRGAASGGLDLRFLEQLGRRSGEIAAAWGLEEPAAGGLAALVGGPFPASQPGGCPACGGGDRRRHPVKARFPGRTYRRCPRCGMIYQTRLSPPPVEYGKDYFFDAYRRQYGKTYLEDFPHLQEMGTARLRHIRALRPPAPGESRLLDIGCAYGPFLAAAREGGYVPAGIDPAEDAVAYVRDTLGIPAFRGFFPVDLPREIAAPEGFEVVSLWYVIEHFEDPRRVLEAARRLLKDGGVLAFSTPSGSGVSGRFSPRRFLEKSPADHWTIWSPAGCRKLLKKFGFELRKIVSTGHHPERFPLAGGYLSEKRGGLYRIFLGISRAFRLGDTFEVYAVKKPGYSAALGGDTYD